MTIKSDPLQMSEKDFWAWWRDLPIAEAQPWREGRSLTDFGAVTASWLRGEINWNPLQCSPAPEAETLEALESLLTLNRRGFVTASSQPGLLCEGGAQRAFVYGFCTERTAATIALALMWTDLVALTFPPGNARPVDSGGGTVVTRGRPWDAETGKSCGPVKPVSFAGRPAAGGYARAFKEVGAVGIASVIESAWEVQIFDPVWGRDDLLLRTLDGVLSDPA